MLKAEESCGPPGPAHGGVTREAADWLHWGRRARAANPPFDVVWQAQRPRVWALAARLAGSADAADDLTQEVGVRALQGYPAFRGDSDVTTWLYRITLNVVRRHAPRGAKETPSAADGEDGGAMLAAVAPREDQPEERLLRSEGIPDVRRALDALPDELRTPLVLQVYEELKCREIADLLELPLGTVLSRLHTARKRLLTILSEGNTPGDAL